MDDLAAQMGMSKKTLYVHFRSKQELLEAVIEGKFTEMEARLAALHSDEGGDLSGDFPAVLAGFMAGVAESVGEITPTFVRDVAKSAPALREKILRRRHAVLGGALGRILAQGRREGRVRPEPPAGLLVEILLEVMDTIAVPENVQRLGFSPQQLISGILDIFLHGVLTPQPGSRSSR